MQNTSFSQYICQGNISSAHFNLVTQNINLFYYPYTVYACENCVLYARQTNFISYICMRKLHIICTPNKFHIIYMHAKTAYYMHAKQISYYIYACENCILYADQTNISYACMRINTTCFCFYLAYYLYSFS